MDDAPRTVLAGLAAGLFFFGIVGAGLGLGPQMLVVMLAGVVIGTTVLAVMGFSAWAVMTVWAGAIAVVGALLMSIEPSLIAALGSVFYGSLLVLPWLFATFILRGVLPGGELPNPRT